MGQGGPQKISVIGNAAGGKTRLSLKLAQMYDLPLTHVDSIQFLAGMKIRPHKESIEILRGVQSQERWLLDGYGPLDILVERLKLADQIVFIDLPLWRHYLWSTKRQIQNLWRPRAELPEGCDEATWQQTMKLFKTLWQVHTKMRPEMLRILSRDEFKNKVLVISNLREWQRVYNKGLAR